MEGLEEELASLSPDQRRLVERWLHQEQAAVVAAPPPSPIPSGYATTTELLSFAQQRLWFLHQLVPDSAAYTIRTTVRLVGRLDVAVLKRSLNAVVRRHATLRTTFASQDGQPQQVIAPALTIAMPLLDLSQLPDDVQDACIQQLARAQAAWPFDLARGPLLRVRLLRLRADAHALLMTMHHIISDGWSQGLQLRELLSCYAAFASGQPAPLPDLPIQYVDYVRWQRQWLAGPAVDEQRAFWQALLTPTPPALALPTDRPRPALQTNRGAVCYFAVPARVHAGLTALSRREGVTLFMTLLSAFAALLARSTGQDDLVVGTPVAGRTRAEFEELIGLFVNMLALRLPLGGDPPFHELLQRLRRVALDAYAHQDVPFEQVVDTLQLARDLSRHPIYQVMLVLQNAPMPPLQGSGLRVLPIEIATTTATLDLALFFREWGGVLNGRVEYNTDLFDATTIRRMIGQLQRVLEAITADAGQRLLDLPLLTAAERHQLLLDWNDTLIAHPPAPGLAALLQAQAAQRPDAVALVLNDQHISYATLNRRSNQLGHYLRCLGVGSETLVGLCVERSVELVLGLLGVLKAGGAYLPLDPTYPQERLAFMLADAHPTVLLTATDYADTETQRAPSSVAPALRAARTVVDLRAGWPQIAQMPAHPPASSVGPDNLAYVLYTSGSTGRPKGVLGHHRGILNRLDWMWQTHPFAADEVGCHKTSLNFVDSVWEIFGPLLQGRPLVLIPDPLLHDTPQFVETLARTGVTRLVLVPALLRVLLESQPDLAQRLTRLTSWISSGEALPVELAQRFHAQLPHARLLNLYGASEVAADALWCETQPHRAFAAVPIGRPIANTQAYLLDAHMQPVPIGVVGEVYLGGAGVARGYLGRPDLTAARFVPNPFAAPEDERRTTNDERDSALFVLRPASCVRLYRTGDLARYRPDGSIEFAGRADQQVKLRGFRIEPGEIEATLLQHAAVREASVLVREDRPGEQRLVAYVVPAADERQTTNDASASSSSVVRPSSFAQELRAHLGQTLPSYMIPSAFVLLDALPRTPNRKLDRRALPAPERPGSRPADDFVAPRTANEAALAAVWMAVLGLERVGVHDNFFALGGDSIRSMQVIARARQAGLQLAPRHVFQHQTIAELSAVKGSAGAILADQGLVTGPVPLLPVQHWFFERGLPPPYHWVITTLLQVDQPLDPHTLRTALQQVIVHHDVLRMRITRAEGAWRQVFVAPDEDVPFSLHDLSDVPEAEQSAAIVALAAELRNGLDLATGPIIRVALMHIGPQQPVRLLIVMHHMAGDGISWRIVLSDLQLAYLQLNQGAPVQLPPKTTSIKQLSERLATYAQSPALRSSLSSFWLTRPWHKVAQLPVDYPDGRDANTIDSTRTVTVRLDAQETDLLLHTVLKTYRAQIMEVLLATLALVLADWNASQVQLIDVVGHGRETIFDDLDLSRTVGWLSTAVPVVLDLGTAHDPVTALRSVMRQLPRLSTYGIEYQALRYLCDDPAVREQLRALPAYEVAFNYLGQVEQLEPSAMLTRPAPEAASVAAMAIDTQLKRQSLLHCSGRIAHDQLTLYLKYSEHVHKQATIAKLGQAFAQALRALIASCAPEAQGAEPSMQRTR
jgi:amino acid adenylation domain-containing protein/non-ribosomal peptide synthase protein (TIGR01720 family)